MTGCEHQPRQHPKAIALLAPKIGRCSLTFVVITYDVTSQPSAQAGAFATAHHHAFGIVCRASSLLGSGVAGDDAPQSRPARLGTVLERSGGNQRQLTTINSKPRRSTVTQEVAGSSPVAPAPIQAVA